MNLLDTLTGDAFVPMFGDAVSMRLGPFWQTTQRIVEDRVSAAMRNWTAGRAAIDLSPVESTRWYGALPPLPERHRFPPPPAAASRPEPARMPSAKPSPKPREQDIDFGMQAEKLVDFKFEDRPNYYEVLQISPRADIETLHRIYRIMAARFHPDNRESGDHQRFLQLKEAYEILSDPGRRAQYDAALQAYETQPLPIFGLRVFVDGLQGEANRRLGVLSLLYQRRRSNQVRPGVSVLELETRMGLPREHLEFTLWYLRSKELIYVTQDNSDFALTVTGVDQVESQSSRNHIVRELLASGSEHQTAAPSVKRRASEKVENRPQRRRKRPNAVR